MKLSRILSALVLLGALAATRATRADEIDITEALKQTTDIDQIAHDLSLGNASNGQLVEAYLRWTPGEDTLALWGKLRLHNKHQQCVKVFGTKNCWDVYNYWVNVRFEIWMRDCRVTGIDVSSENELYKIPGDLASALGNFANALQGGTVLAGMPGCE